MKKIKPALIILLSAMLLLVAACSSSGNLSGGNNGGAASNNQANTDAGGQANKSTEGTKLKVGVTIPDSTHPFFILLIKAIEERLAAENGELLVFGANNDVNKQINDIENMVASKVQVILINAMEPKAVESAVQHAQAAGVKFIALGNDDMPYVDVTQTISHKEIGKLMGETAAKWINEKLDGKAEVGLIVSSANQSLIDRSKALEEAIRNNAPGAKIVSVQEARTQAAAQGVAENMLTANPNLQVIATMMDPYGLGALEAVKAAGRDNGKFFINGTDGTPQALAEVKAGGAFRATLDLETAKQPDVTMNHIMKLVKGERVDKIYFSKLTVLDGGNIDQFAK
ncbi:sugar ABC transporter substrate-binding protein [Paenibacillus validus]|uniref:Substrate-binding domain-containing protein n=1 Tax=Paenibacillus validus TaxID=44253 RepID=A0A7X2Z7W4_9BACL|nr:MULTISPECIES: sugar ABC transporter substrate-binding protein [Paenibacillus]MED4601909.1 sugar ABC transporter substrate-binding protein [Paenibacillus validus]MED4606964.1 sugar ABC transporter substrate-binding protein [Paenibacillus validus]MUG69934.1 substrate-binding domain-containing protein [Paenibacillus validus]